MVLSTIPFVHSRKHRINSCDISSLARSATAPSGYWLTFRSAVFPRFSYPDVNFWIWVFGRRYRQVVKGWEASVRGPDRASDRRTNWSGAALATFYSAVRQALVVAIILRALATGLGLGGLLWWGYRKWAGDAEGRVEL